MAEVLFIPPAWPRITTSQAAFIPILIAGPYIFLYLSTATTSNITAHNQRDAMLVYPYDFTLFHPGYFCSSCHRPKPPRSKHCSICKACVQKQDHHCIWINNCVGRNNYLWFNLLLVSVSVVLAYGALLGYWILDSKLQEHFVPSELTRGSLTTKRWSTRFSWSEYVQCWSWVMGLEWRIGAVSLLAFLCFPLSTGFLVYHTYLVWAGMTTNESAKWSDWQEDIDDGLVYRAEISQLRETFRPLPEDVEPREEEILWPRFARPKWWLIRTRDGEQPTKTVEKKNRGPGGDENVEEPDMRWVKVKTLREVDNIYDLGFWRNLKDALFNRG